MRNIKIMGHSSLPKTRTLIAQECGIPKYFPDSRRRRTASHLINYGYPHYTGSIPAINRNIPDNKYEAIQRAEQNGVPVPATRLYLLPGDRHLDFLVKPYHSQAGHGIRIAQTSNMLSNQYYQKRIIDRKYELRIHAFWWIDSADWHVQKRLGSEDEVTWNYHTGGRFLTVKEPQKYRVFRDAIKHSLKVLEALNMRFGAVDFIVDTDHNLYFLEINSAPAATTLSAPIYINAFNMLKDLTDEQLNALTT